MESPANITQVTGTGDVTTTTTWVHSVTLTALDDEDDATLTLRAGGMAGDVKLTLAAPAGTSVVAELHGAQFTGGVHATLAGTDATATLAYV